MKNESIDPTLMEFAAELEEISARVQNVIQTGEKQELTSQQIDALYRDIHTLKGSCMLFGFEELGALAHVLESHMEPVRLKKAHLKDLGIDRLLKANDLYIEFTKNFTGVMSPEFKAKVVKATAEFSGAPIASPKAPIPLPSAAVEAAAAAAPTPAASGEQGDANTTVRVSVSLLDNLMSMMGEMVLVRNQVLQYSNKTDDLEFLNLSQRLDIVTSDLQSEVMKTRMQPIGIVLSKFQRVVRDLARELNKKIELSLEGTETELDKSLLEAIKDPLTHVVRNACDHGLETPEERRMAGKSDVGQILIRSFHEGGQVIIEISDNGRGLNRDKLIKKAIEKGIVSAEKSAKMSDREAHDLIFAAGFSTAAAVTNISGRGVGMDVVKNNIEKIGGRVELRSEFGKGMTLSLKIPLTLAIVPAMTIRCGEEKYAIPQVKLVELVRVSTESAEETIEFIQGKPVFRLRGNILPLVMLNEVFGYGTQEQKDYNIVVLNADGRIFGLVVDEINDTADIVVKPLSRFLKKLTIFSGATVLGDGSVSLILDVLGLAKYAHIGVKGSEEITSTNVHKESVQNLQEFLFCKVDSPTMHGVPLAVVHRLEEFKWEEIEMSGQIPVVQYRETLLPIISLSEFLGYRKFDAEKLSKDYSTCKAVVIKKNTKLFAIQVHEILDVISTSANIDETIVDRPGILGSVIVNESLAMIVDAYTCIESLSGKNANFHDDHSNVVAMPGRDKIKILLVEDTVFFQKHVANVLRNANYEVTVANHGAEGLEILSRQNFDVILSDIEMPVMNGIEFVKSVRSQPKYKHMPVIALTMKYSELHILEGKAAGFTEYLEKFKSDEVLKILKYYTSRMALNEKVGSL